MELILRARAKGYRVWFESKAVVTHDPERRRVADIFKYTIQHAATTIILRSQYRRILRTPFILRSSALTLLAAPMIALKVCLNIYSRNFYIAKLIWTAPVVYGLKLAWCWGAAKGLRTYKSYDICEDGTPYLPHLSPDEGGSGDEKSTVRKSRFRDQL